MTDDTTQVLMVDGDGGAIRAVEGYLRTRDYRVRACGRAARALDFLAKESPDLMILDRALPDMDGLELCRKVKSLRVFERLPVMFLSSKASPADRIAGLEAGGDDYVAKPFDLRELELRIKAMLRGASVEEDREKPNELMVGALRLDLRTYRAYVDGREIPLTPVEFEVLRYLMGRPGEVVSPEQLLQEVWRYYAGTGDPAIVRVQIMNLRNKIEADRSHPVHIQTVYRHGYMVMP